jgi:RNA polymerase sigma-70 factor (ECF subfamily)
MADEERDAVETAIRAACAAGDYERGATLTIEHYGAELLGFLTSQARDPDVAGEVFGHFSEVFWKTLPAFEWRCSARTWAYKLARRSLSDVRRREKKYGGAQGLTKLSQLSAVVERVRTATHAYKRTAIKDGFQALREQLTPEDQTLLVLRVDRGLSWLELAEVMLGEDAEPTEEILKTEAARLRKRFQIAKDRLRELAKDAGLLRDE